MQTKKCNKCEAVKPISEFYPYQANADGYEHICKACRNKAASKRAADRRAKAKREAGSADAVLKARAYLLLGKTKEAFSVLDHKAQELQGGANG
ncbi:hypothetical protein [Neptuniibacter sp.]|uniref:hypothetical protein n=1 Tax=Neptuniibacter sp. TaxID=1962643 RepID=UPI002611DC6F|nr:hypothetical protein [Neptuniibacter sp.]MCP4596158.1 hypothetical protein [Neptuniibacter sp.]